MRRLGRRIGHYQRLRVGEAHIFGSTDDNTTSDEVGIFTGFNHTRQIIHRRIRVRTAHAFDERGNRIVMAVALFVVRINATT